MISKKIYKVYNKARNVKTGVNTMSDTANNTWPGAWGIFKRSQEAMMVNVGPILGLIGVYILIAIALSIAGLKDTDILRNVIDLVVSSALTVAFVKLVMAGVRGQKMEFVPAAKSCLSMKTLQALGLTIITGFILVFSLLALIVPFFIVLPRISLAGYFLIDKNMGVFESLSASWAATKGSAGKVWGVIGVSILFALAIIILVGIYLTFVYAAASALLYAHLSSQKNVFVEANAK